MKRGYQRRGREEWQEIIDAQHKSGGSIAAWCREHDVSSTSFYQWRKRLRRGPDKNLESFIEVRPERTSPGRLSVTTPGGYRLEIPAGVDAGHLEQVIRILAVV